MDKEFILHCLNLEIDIQLYKNFVKEHKLEKEMEKYWNENYDQLYEEILSF